MSARETTGRLKAALLKAFPLPEYATFFEVADGTGARQSRWVDAVAMSCWPSRGLRVLGFEVKASRSDWLREKKNPGKSCAVQDYCDEWYLVSTSGVLLDPWELPQTWGHLEFDGRKLVTKKPAPALSAAPLSREFVASLLRRAGQADKDVVAAAVAEQCAEVQAEIDKRVAAAVEQRTRAASAAEQACAAFREATGVDLVRGGYALCEIGEDVGKDFAEWRGLRSQLRHVDFDWPAERLRKAADAITSARAALETMGVLAGKST